MNLISKTFTLAVLAAITSSLLSPTSFQAQTTSQMLKTADNAENIVSHSTGSGQLRQEYHRTLGQMQQMLGQMHQQVERMTPEQLQQNRQQLEQMMEQMEQMLGQYNSRLPENFDYHHNY